MPTAIEQRIISETGLRAFWPERVRRHAERIAARPPSAGEREDLRELPLVTIDGANARDFDDAVFAESAGAGWRVVVAIADVSHYVRPADALDREAARRGVSAYFPGSVLPMLPEVLSNDLCSLKPEVDRLCLACEMRLDANGRLKSWRFFRAVMRSAARLTYSGVHAAIEAGNLKARGELGALLEPVERLYAVWRSLSNARGRRGALDVDLAETVVRLGPNGEVRSLEQTERYNAHRVIEELMITANVATARFLGRARMPALYRVHSPPDAEGFEELRNLYAGAGHPLSEAAGRNPDEINQALRALLARRGRPAYETIAVATLRCMQPACYQPANIGHYGLALKSYTHFTSPIRRYPDLLAHRAIKHLLDGGRGEAAPLRGGELAAMGLACSERERQAEGAMRGAVKAYKLRYLSGCLGDTLDAVVSHGTGKGLFVQVPEIGMKGMIPRWRLPSPRSRRRTRGADRGQRLHGFNLGQRVLVRVARVDEDRGHLDLDLLPG